jgi:hypothetical protein
VFVMQRREFLGGVLALPLLGVQSGEIQRAWLSAVTGRTGDTRALERLGVWLQVAARPAAGELPAPLLRRLQESQERDGYLGVYPRAHRLGGSDRGVDEYWGMAEVGRGLLNLAERGENVSHDVARRLGDLLITVQPDRLDRDPSQQHTGGAALLYFLTGMARRTRDRRYADYLRLLPPRMGLPREKSEFGVALPPVLDRWTGEPLRNARGVTALGGILALGRYQGYPQLQEAVRERWTELRRSFPATADTELLARWARLTADLKGLGDQQELTSELERLGKLHPAADEPYSALLQVLVR